MVLDQPSSVDPPSQLFEAGQSDQRGEKDEAGGLSSLASLEGEASSEAGPSGTDGEPGSDPEALTRISSGPAYSVFSKSTRRWVVTLVTFTSFVSPMTANIYFPVLTPIAEDLGVSISLINLTLTTYMIFQAIVSVYCAVKYPF